MVLRAKLRPGWANLRAWWAKIRPERALIANGGGDGRTVGQMEGHLEIHPSYRTSAAAQKGEHFIQSGYEP